MLVFYLLVDFPSTQMLKMPGLESWGPQGILAGEGRQQPFLRHPLFCDGPNPRSQSTGWVVDLGSLCAVPCTVIPCCCVEPSQWALCPAAGDLQDRIQGEERVFCEFHGHREEDFRVCFSVLLHPACPSLLPFRFLLSLDQSFVLSLERRGGMVGGRLGEGARYAVRARCGSRDACHTLELSTVQGGCAICH